MTYIHIDGDFPVKGSECKHHCSPSCHPAQIGPDWKYGCLHPAWPQNRYDFCPIVECMGEIKKCEIPVKLILRLINGRKRRIKNAYTKIEKYEREIIEFAGLISNRP